MKKIVLTIVTIAVLVFAIAACGVGTKETKTEEENEAAEEEVVEVESAESESKTFKVGLSQGTMNHPFRVAMVEENIDYAKEHYPEMEIIATDGNNESSKQVSDVEDLLAQDIDLLLISPLTAEALTDICIKAMEQGVPVVTLDRNVNADVTCFVGAENKPMGIASAKKLAEMTDGKANIIEIQGTAGSSATIDRHGGFVEELENYPDMNIIAEQYCDYVREPAMTYMEDMLQRFDVGEIDAIYAHNDEMALGALEAIRAANRLDEKIIIIGMDGSKVAFDAIKDGDMAFTVFYPYCAPEGVQVAWDILNGKDVESRMELETDIVDIDNVDEWMDKGL